MTTQPDPSFIHCHQIHCCRISNHSWHIIYIYIYIYRFKKQQKLENKQNKTAMIVLRVASESIRNMNEIEDSNKNRNKKYAKS